MWQSNSWRCRLASRVTTEPMSTSPPPLGYLVMACMEISTPRLNGAKATPAPQVLSSAVMMRRAPSARCWLAACTTATSAGMSGYSSVTEPGASSHTSRVAGVMQRARSAGSMAL